MLQFRFVNMLFSCLECNFKSNNRSWTDTNKNPFREQIEFPIFRCMALIGNAINLLWLLFYDCNSLPNSIPCEIADQIFPSTLAYFIKSPDL